MLSGSGMFHMRSAGVALEVNLRNLLHAGNEPTEGSTLALKPMTNLPRSLKQCISGPTKVTFVHFFF